MVDALRAGDTFAAAAASHPEAFPNFYVGILESAELTGNLDTVLDQLADYIERDVEARSTLTSALIYPAVVVLHVHWSRHRSGDLRDATVRCLLQVAARQAPPSHAHVAQRIKRLFHVLVRDSQLFVIAVVVGFVAMRRSAKGRAMLDSIILKLPVLGLLVQAAVLERVCRVLSSMLKAGVDLPQAMAVTAEASNNAVYRNGLGHIREQMMEGQGSGGTAR